MSQVAKLVGIQTIPPTVISGAGTTTGKWMSIPSIDKISFQAEWTGTLAGTFFFDVTNYPPFNDGSQPIATAKATALTLPASFAAGNPAGSAGDFMFEFVNMSEVWIRPRFVYASGSGTLTVTTGAKGV